MVYTLFLHVCTAATNLHFKIINFSNQKIHSCESFNDFNLKLRIQLHPAAVMCIHMQLCHQYRSKLEVMYS